MKILYFCRVNKDDHKNYGVIQKCESQARAFRKLGLGVDLIYLSNQGILKNEKLLHSFSFPWLTRRWTTYLFYFFSLLRIIYQKITIEKYQVIYIRYAMAHPLLMRFLKKAKKQNPKVKIILEIPTFPYDEEPTGFAASLSLLMDKRYRSKLKSLVNFIGHYGLEKEIYGIPVIPLRNGIEVEKIRVSGSIPVQGVLRLIGVANWSYWHGMDRLLEGLRNYYEGEEEKEVQIQLKIIGGGKAIEKYKALVERFELKNQVEFIPPTIGKTLDRYFDSADLGVGCLGLFRKGVKLDSSLKTREYCSRGIPFIFSGKDLDFPEGTFFAKKIPHQEGSVDVEEVLSFWKSIKSKKNQETENGHLEIRKYAETNLTWEQQLKGMGIQMKKE